MKKIFMTVPIIVLVFMVYSCSKDHDVPTFSIYEDAKAPTDVMASYNLDSESFEISWTMVDDEDVTDYYIVVSDSLDFNGLQFSRSIGSIETTYNMAADFITVHEDSVDSFSSIRYFAVKAVYIVQSADKSNYFVGPQSTDSDSALYISQ